MKKIFSITFILLSLSMCYAERNNRINLSLNYISGKGESNPNGDKQTISKMENYPLGIEYTKIFENNFLLGGGLQLGTTTIEWEKKSSTAEYSAECASISFFPIIGKAYGKNQNTQIIIHPIKFNSITSDVIDIKNNGENWSGISSVIYKTGLYYSKQWGKNKLRNGFIVGFDLLWHSTGDFKIMQGSELTIGYKLSIGF